MMTDTHITHHVITTIIINIFDKLEEGEDEIIGKDEREQRKFMNIELFYVNINGLNENKTRNSDFLQDTQNADIICLTETHLNVNNEQSLQGNYSSFHTNVEKNNNRGRNIKGVSIFVKEIDYISQPDVENLVKEKGNLQILKLSSTYWNNLQDLFLIVCYVDNRDSNYKDRELYENIEQYMTQFKMKNIIMIGDFNGRIGNETNYSNLGLSDRKSDDLMINTMGRDLINFCNETSLIIANGRLENNSEGRCTYYRYQNNEVRKSVIDYLLLSESMINHLTYFQIMGPAVYTDHSPMQIKFQIELKSEFTKQEQLSNR